MRSLLIHLVFIVVTLGFGLLSGLANLPDEWYQSLDKPPFNPPAYVFGPVWTTLYVLIAIAGARMWLRAPASAAMQLWFGQMIFNLLWSPSFFGLQSPALGLVVILPLLGLIVAFIAKAWDIDRPSGLLFIPYAAWVGFASLLNLSLFVLN